MMRITRFLWWSFWLFAGCPALSSGQSNDPGGLSVRDSPASTKDSTISARDSAKAKSNNTDSVHHTDTTRYHLSFSGTGTLNQTNSLRSYVLNNSSKLSMVKKSAAVNFTNTWIYGLQEATVTNNDFSSSLDMGLYKTLKHFYYWGMANYTTSVSLLINHQAQAALGVGYNLIDKKKAVLILSDGPLYEKGDLYDSLYGGPNGNLFQRDRYQIFRNSFRILYRWVIQDRYFLDGTFFTQNALDNWSDYILKLTGSFSIKLEKWLSFTVSAMYNEFTRTRRENTLVTIGLTVQK